MSRLSAIVQATRTAARASAAIPRHTWAGVDAYLAEDAAGQAKALRRLNAALRRRATALAFLASATLPGDEP